MCLYLQEVKKKKSSNTNSIDWVWFLWRKLPAVLVVCHNYDCVPGPARTFLFATRNPSSYGLL
jgi:hypothetical protein